MTSARSTFRVQHPILVPVRNRVIALASTYPSGFLDTAPSRLVAAWINQPWLSLVLWSVLIT